MTPTIKASWERTDRFYHGLGRYLYVCFLAIIYKANAEPDLCERLRPSQAWSPRLIERVKFPKQITSFQNSHTQ